jgi:hypothetical protein
MERVRSLRARLVTSHSGGLGTPPAGHYGPAARSSLHVARRYAVFAEARPEIRKMPRWSAERRAR